ncbi:MAG: hypothetical protein JRK26_27310 [Deltaproteobacteria bacterium]|nr:hypothetical protein [Deltaproteobacteria bacterium]
MNTSKVRKLTNIAEKLKAIADDLNQLVAELDKEEQKPVHKRAKKSSSSVNVPPSIEELKQFDRKKAIKILDELKQKDVAQLYSDLGGASRDKKKPKDWLIERILWQLFDFQSGHDILKDKR